MPNLTEREDEDASMRDYVDKIDDMLLDETYTFASDTLSSIRDYIRRFKRITPAQQRAVDNIEEGGQRGDNFDRHHF